MMVEKIITVYMGIIITVFSEKSDPYNYPKLIKVINFVHMAH